VVVVDADRRFLDLNPAAGRVFDLSAEVIGAPLDTALDDTPDLDALLATSGEPTEFTSDGRIYEATPSVIRDEYDRLPGHSVVFHDVTRTRQRSWPVAGGVGRRPAGRDSRVRGQRAAGDGRDPPAPDGVPIVGPTSGG
jgi:PAS domain-containing protein